MSGPSKDSAGRNKVPPRRSYKKSRNGCDQCKERHVKCDEGRPQCANCVHRELSCTFLKVPRASVQNSPPQRPVPDDMRNIALPSQEPDCELLYSARDLGLMHKFATDSYESLCGDRSDAHAWQYSIPQQAYSREYLLHGMLAFAALHIASTNSDSKTALKYLYTAVEYNSLSFGSFQNAISQLTPQTCESTFACSAIVMVISIALPCLSAKYRGEKLLMLGNMTTAWELYQGGRRISHISEPWLHGSIFSNYDFWKMQSGDLDPETKSALNQLDELNHLCLIDNPDTDNWESNRETIELLRLCFSKFAHSPHPAAILSWLAYLKKAFVDQLSSLRPLPLIVFMHWGVLLNELGYRFWWAQGSGKALVAELSDELRSLKQDPRWAPALEWPQRQILS